MTIRWLFYSLLTANIVLLVLQWSSQRDIHRLERFSYAEGVVQIKLVQFDLARDGQECILLGPYDEEDVARDIAEGLKGFEFRTEFLKKDVGRAPAYQVYVTAFKDGLSAAQQVREFKRINVDSYVIGTGDLKGKVSVGVFKNIDSTRRMRKIMSKKGYETEISEIKRFESEFWVQVEERYTAENKRKIAQFLTFKNAESEMRQFFCKSVASEK